MTSTIRTYLFNSLLVLYFPVLCIIYHDWCPSTECCYKLVSPVSHRLHHLSNPRTLHQARAKLHWQHEPQCLSCVDRVVSKVSKSGRKYLKLKLISPVAHNHCSTEVLVKISSFYSIIFVHFNCYFPNFHEFIIITTVPPWLSAAAGSKADKSSQLTLTQRPDLQRAVNLHPPPPLRLLLCII